MPIVNPPFMNGCVLWFPATGIYRPNLFFLHVVYVPFNSHPCSILEVLRLIVAIQLERRDQRKENIGST